MGWSSEGWKEWIMVEPSGEGREGAGGGGREKTGGGGKRENPMT